MAIITDYSKFNYTKIKVPIYMIESPSDDRGERHFVNVNIDNKEYYTFDRKFNKEFSLDIPKGCFAVVTIGNKALYAQRKAPDRKGGKRLASGMPYSNVNLKYFIDSVNNLNRGLMRRYPDGGFKLLDSSEWKERSNDL